MYLMVNLTGTTLRVALPTSILVVEHGRALRSIRIHQIARWSSIFGAHEVIFYKEPTTTNRDFREHKTLIEDHWRYFFTPPYLRKQLIPLTPTLKYVGLLPPIRLEIFNVNKRPRVGEIRLGYVYMDNDGTLKALIGDTLPYTVIGECKEAGEIRTLVVKSTEKRTVECVNKYVYTGPRLSFANSLREVLERYRKKSRYIIVTDRTGEVPTYEQVKILRGSDVTILFGGPKHDLFEIAKQEGFDLKEHADYVWNTIPLQKVVTVRTEEALIITLGVINAFLGGIRFVD